MFGRLIGIAEPFPASKTHEANDTKLLSAVNQMGEQIITSEFMNFVSQETRCTKVQATAHTQEQQIAYSSVRWCFGFRYPPNPFPFFSLPTLRTETLPPTVQYRHGLGPGSVDQVKNPYTSSAFCTNISELVPLIISWSRVRVLTGHHFS